jgi:hypothetical protein
MLNVATIVAAVVILVVGNNPQDIGYSPSESTYSIPSEFELFAEAIAKFESNGDFTVVNRYGMMGKYQFSPSTVEFLGFDESQEEFLMRPHLQDSAFVSYYTLNKKELQYLINKFSGNTDRGFRITQSGILAGEHFAGARGVRLFLENPDDATGIVDGNGTSLAKYMKKFADYDLD